MAPTGIAAYGIRGWTLNFGLAIPVKNWGELGAAALGRLQTRWRNTKVLILDEKSMIGRLGFGKMDRRLRQVFPHSGEEILGGMAVLLFGDFAQLPPIGDKPLYSDVVARVRTGLSEDGRRAYLSFNQSITLQHIFRQNGLDAESEQFRDALLRQRTYAITEQDFELFSTCPKDRVTSADAATFKDALRLFPTRASVDLYNHTQLAISNKPVVRCKAKHGGGRQATAATEEDADGLVKEILLAEGARVMITRNLWTAQGMLLHGQIMNFIMLINLQV